MGGVVLAMSDRILLLLGIQDAGKRRMSIKKGKNNRRDINIDTPREEEEARAVEAAFSYAESLSKKVVAIQILGSNLYHWGRTDILLLRRAKRGFLSYVRDDVLSRGKEREQRLKAEADKRGISMDILSIESDDPVPVVLEEANKGYDKIFLAKEKGSLFPIFSKTMEQHLRKKGFTQIEIC